MFWLSRLPAVLALFTTITSCAPVDILNATVPATGVTVTHDIAYGPQDRQRLDIYKPDGATAAPVVVFFYGGSWDNGSRAEYRFVAEPLARQGIVVVVPDYRLYPQVRFPAFLQDSAQAVAWVLDNAAGLGGDPRRVVVVGHSAGAYNAAMVGLDPALLAHAGHARAALAGVVGIAGPYDFLPLTDPKLQAIFAPGNDGPATQPITYVDGHNPPMLLLAGTADDTVYPRNTANLAAAIKAAGGAVTTKTYEGVGHIGIVTAFAPLFQARAPVLDDVVAFVRQVPAAHPPE